MRPQKVTVDSWYMLSVSCGCIGLIIAVRVLLRLVQAIFWLPGYIEKMEKKVAEEQLKIKMENEKKLMQDTEASNIKNDIKKYIKQNDIDDEKGEAFEEMISEEQTEIETSEYKKNKDD